MNDMDTEQGLDPIVTQVLNWMHEAERKVQSEAMAELAEYAGYNLSSFRTGTCDCGSDRGCFFPQAHVQSDSPACAFCTADYLEVSSDLAPGTFTGAAEYINDRVRGA